MKKLYEGKAKQILETQDPDQVEVYFKDSATAFDGEKAAEIAGKGHLNALISIRLFELLEESGIPTHYVRQVEHGFVARHVRIFPLEVVIRNVAAGSLVRRLGVENGTVFETPLLEFFYKCDELHDPLICRNHIALMALAKEDEVEEMSSLALATNERLKAYFLGLDLILVDMKFEFGRTRDGKIVLADEISPDTLRLWKKGSDVSLDKDVFRFDKGDLIATYTELARRMGVLPS
jgi:phosphoribosylaminoimidazole-succinocarboxamide synthase